MSSQEEQNRPIFIEKTSDGEKDLVELEEILKKVPNSKKNAIQKQMASIKKGIQGENNIIFELKNCQIPMICLHNLYLTFEDITSQIDFIFVMRDKIYVVESKNLYGEIEINERGEFFRVAHGEKQRMYSPLTQCEHHLNTMKMLRSSISKDEFPRLYTEKHYEDNFHPLIVISNPSCKLNIDKAPKEITDKIIHADQLARYILANDDKSNYITQRAMVNFAEFYSHYHGENPRNYMNSYRNLVKMNETPMNSKQKQEQHDTPTCPWCKGKLAIREAQKGKHAGIKFYGCSNYPKCQYADYSKKTKVKLNPN